MGLSPPCDTKMVKKMILAVPLEKQKKAYKKGVYFSPLFHFYNFMNAQLLL